MVENYKEPQTLTEAQRVAAGGTVDAIHKIVTIIVHDHASLVAMGAAVKFLGAMMEIRGGLKDTPFRDIAVLTVAEVRVCNETIRSIARNQGIPVPRGGPRSEQIQEHSEDMNATSVVTAMNAPLRIDRRRGS